MNNGTFDWQPCVDAVTDDHLKELAAWRGYSLKFCKWLRDQSLIGHYGLGWAFPVQDEEGQFLGVHYLNGDPTHKNWLKHPKGFPLSPFVIGKIQSAEEAHCFESQWDAFAYLDLSGDYMNESAAVIITRGASNGPRAASRVYDDTELYLWPQNDKPGKNGTPPASEIWFNAIQSVLDRNFYRVSIPRAYKDLNDWTRAGATKSAILQAVHSAAPIVASGENSPQPLRPMPSWIDYGDMLIDESQYHIGKGFLEIGSISMLIGQSYIGKSTLITQFSINAAIGRQWLFFNFPKALRILVVQAEDPKNKRIKMGKMYKRMGLTKDQVELIRENTRVLTIRDLQDKAAIVEIERHALEFKPDIIVINPMTSYLSGTVYKDEAINQFLRVQLTPMLDRLDASAIVVHHPPKPTMNDKEPKDLTAYELQYTGAGMAALTNAPRSNMFLVHIDGDVFKLSAGKGFEDLGTPETTAYLRRSKDEKGTMLWERCDSEKAEEANEKLLQRKSKKTKDHFIPYDRLLKCFKPTHKYPPAKVIELAKKDLNKGENWAKNAMKQLASEKKLAKTKEHNPEGQPFVFYHLPTLLEPATEINEEVFSEV